MGHRHVWSDIFRCRSLKKPSSSSSRVNLKAQTSALTYVCFFRRIQILLRGDMCWNQSRSFVGVDGRRTRRIGEVVEMHHHNARRGPSKSSCASNSR